MQVKESSKRTRSRKANKKLNYTKDGLFPFICGLCDTGYGHIKTFFYHFKEHSDHVKLENFNNCELHELENLNRDYYEQTEETGTFNCYRCMVTLPTICLLHAHIQNHEPNGSYTVDIQTRTGYPSPDQYPYVKLRQLTNQGNLSTRNFTRSDSNYGGEENNSTDIIVSEVKPDVEENKTKDEVKLEPSSTESGEKTFIDDEICVEWEEDDIEDNFIDDVDSEDPDWTETINELVNSIDEDFVPESDVLLEPEQCSRSTQNTEASKKRKSVVQSGRKKFVFCDVCGVKKEQYLLVSHVEKKHKETELPAEFQKKIEELKENVKCRKVSKHESDETNMPAEVAQDDMNVKPLAQDGINVKQLAQEPLAQDGINVKPLAQDGINVKLDVDHESKVSEDYTADNIAFKTGKKLLKKCKFCGILIQKSRMNRHERFHRTPAGKLMYRPTNLTKCDNCERTVLKINIDKHKCIQMTIKHILNETEVKTVEQKAMEKKERRRKYKKYYYNEKLSCHMCGFLIKRHALKKHLANHSEDRPYSCEKCDKAFKTQEQSKKHFQDSHGMRRFQCDQCPKAFTTSSMMKDHYKIHTDERPYPCLQCGRRFRRKTHMNSHALSHGGDAKHICVECGKKFMRHTNMVEHMKAIHMKIRNWLCSWPQCEKLFFSSTTLRRHMIIHTGCKPEKCEHCDSAFTQRSELKTHLQRKHNINKLPPPTASNPYAGVPHCVVQRADTSPDDTGSQQTKTVKTVMFSSVKTDNDSPYLPMKVENTENVRHGTMSSNCTITGTQNRADTEDCQIMRQHYVSDLQTELGASSSVGTSETDNSVTLYSSLQGSSIMNAEENYEDKSALVPSSQEHQYTYTANSPQLTTMTAVRSIPDL